MIFTMVQELRWADYQAGRNKGSTGGLGLGMSGTKIGGGLFNQNQQSTQTTGGFGAGLGQGGGLFQSPLGGGTGLGTGGGEGLTMGTKQGKYIILQPSYNSNK